MPHHGRGHRPKQFPPSWKNSELLATYPSALAYRKLRNSAVGWNAYYEYAMGMNLVFLTGRVIREPRISGLHHREQAWFRISVPNQDNPGQKCFISVRSRGALAHHVWENITKGDDVAVVGRIWTARLYLPTKRKEQKEWRQIVYVDAERVSGSYPVQLDHDARYLRIRIDLWNRMCKLIPDMAEHSIPVKKREELQTLWQEVEEWYQGIEPEVDADRGDPDPSAEDGRSPGRHE